MRTTIEINTEKKGGTSYMKDMNPLDVAVILDSGEGEGHIIMRTADVDRFEVMDLTEFSPNACWAEGYNIKVRIVEAKLTLTILEPS